MVNWIILYLTNYLLANYTDKSSAPYTVHLVYSNPSSMIPNLGLDKLFAGNSYVTISVVFTVLIAIIIQIVINKTKFGFEIKATGFNKDAAKAAGMKEKKNIVNIHIGEVDNEIKKECESWWIRILEELCWSSIL